MEAPVMEGPSWAAVALAMVNVIQVVALSYIGLQQARSTRERIRRVALDDARRHAENGNVPSA
jgi:hypothetical protein